MRFKSVETTPNPNSMKLNFHDPLGKTCTYTDAQDNEAPEFVVQLLKIDGVNSVFVCNDFITLIRKPTSDWQPIVEKATALFGETDSSNLELPDFSDDEPTEIQVQVFIQTFRAVPIQVKVVGAGGEAREALPARFNEAAMKIQEKTGADFLKERFWDERSTRYGVPVEIAREVADEITGLIDENTLEEIVLKESGQTGLQTSAKIKSHDLDSGSWHERLGAVQFLSESNAPVSKLIEAASDPHPQVRRLVAAALGMTESSEAVPVLSKMFVEDEHVGVRRTAGDALSDIGDPEAEKEVVKALFDKNKLVRWRAARFLFEVGTEFALPYLEKASRDKEYEVKLEVKAALDRITRGDKESLPVWKQMAKKDE